MKSTIRVEMDFDTMQPVLRIIHDPQSDDLRDQTLKYFLEKAGRDGAVMYLTYPENNLMPDGGAARPNLAEIKCEILAPATEEGGDELDFIQEAKVRALSYCKSKQEEQAVGAVFDGWASKASIKMLNEDPESYKAKYSLTKVPHEIIIENGIGKPFKLTELKDQISKEDYFVLSQLEVGQTTNYHWQLGTYTAKRVK